MLGSQDLSYWTNELVVVGLFEYLDSYGNLVGIGGMCVGKPAMDELDSLG